MSPMSPMPSQQFPRPATEKESYGSLQWSTQRSQDLQKVADMFVIEELQGMGFSLTVADPLQPGCPLVACSAGFTELTGYSVQEIVGKNCRFMLNGVPSDLLDEETRMRCRAFCQSAVRGEDFCGPTEPSPEWKRTPWAELPKGEMLCVQMNARKSGELFRNMFYLKQVELDGAPFILGLQAGLPDEIDLEVELSDLEESCRLAFRGLEMNRVVVEQTLAKHYWYSAPMRRQF